MTQSKFKLVHELAQRMRLQQSETRLARLKREAEFVKSIDPHQGADAPDRIHIRADWRHMQ